MRSSILILALLAPSLAQAKTLTEADLLARMTDLDQLTRLQTGITSHQASSYSRLEQTSWGANGDAGQYLRVEEDGQAVMLETDGPGCVFRIWSANPQGRLLLYLDGATSPSYTFDFAQLFTGQLEPFRQPLVYQRDGARSASDCYFPIPFAKHLKICADSKLGQYYHFNYLKFPDDWTVPSFKLPLDGPAQQVLDEVVEAWSHPGRDPKRRLPGQQTLRGSLTLRPGQTIQLADLAGPGSVRAIRTKVACEQRDFPRKLLLRGVWDDASLPQVLSPLGPFYGYDWATPEWGSLISGCLDGQSYFYYPMPFRGHAELSLTSCLELPAQLEYEVEWAPSPQPADMAYFYARWRQERDSPTFDYPILETAGHGHFVGVSLQIDHPIGGWWGEGDEKVWVDDEQFPNWIGTGSEDYFGDAWGIRFLAAPSFGCSYNQGAKTCPYRWHVLDCIPFTKRFRMTLENYGVWNNFDHEHEYSTVAYWYQQEPVPPYEQLQGQTYLGGVAVGQQPAEYPYRGNLFRELGPGDLLSTGLDLPYAQEAEALCDQAVGDGQAKVISDVGLDQPFSREQAVEFVAGAPLRELASLTLVVPKDSVYYPRLYTAALPGLPQLNLVVGTRTLLPAGPAKDGAYDLEAVYLEAGAHSAMLLACSDGRAIFDALQLRPAVRVADAIEAEELAVVGCTSADHPHPAMPNGRPSAGRALGWHPTKPGETMTLQLPERPQQQYVLAVRPMLGDYCGMIQAFDGDRPLGPAFDLYAKQTRLGAELPLGMLPEGADTVTLKVVGKHAASTGYRVGLDYFVWQPVIIHPESTAGVWARVIGAKGCRHTIQNLGSRFLGGHHLWLTGSRQNASVDLGVTVPTAGKYTLTAHYTTSWDYAVVSAELNGKALGEPVDTYSPEVLLHDPVVLGTVELTAGEHVLRLSAKDKNEASRGYLMGLDYLLVQAAE